jgi:hypothetical protein
MSKRAKAWSVFLAITVSPYVLRAETPAPRPPAPASAGAAPAEAPSAAASPPAPASSPAGQSLAAPAPAPPPSTTESDDQAMTFRASDMETFAARSARDVNTGAALRSRYALNLFGDVGGGVISGTDMDTKPTFGVGGLDLLFTGDLDKSIKMTAESAIEFNDANEVGIDLERLHLRWTYRGFWIEAGRSHTDLGFWNLAYHHGKWLQPTIERPLAARFEDDGGILPVHWIGVQAGYRAELGGDAVFTVSAAVGNGRGAIVDNIQSREDEHVPKQFYGKAEIKGLFTRDLRVGISGLHGYISSQPVTVRPALPNVGIYEEIGNVYVVHASYPFTLITEAFAIKHHTNGSQWLTYDAFAVAGYTVGIVTPYLSGERRIATTNSTDPFFAPDPAASTIDLDVAEGIAGLRVDLSTWSALKAEYRHARSFDQARTTRTVYLSWQFGI